MANKKFAQLTIALNRMLQAQVASYLAYLEALDRLQLHTQLPRDMLDRWCRELATTSGFTHAMSAEILDNLWLLSDERLLLESILYSRGS